MTEIAQGYVFSDLNLAFRLTMEALAMYRTFNLYVLLYEERII